ncbi:MAG: dimethyl sulfoxide reductase anchor subunit family protein [Gammaproteobacteria bacterium]
MKPALSIVVFTVLSGAGLGLAAVLAAAVVVVGAAADVFWLSLALSALLTGGGLLASVGHLANPKNAWRAIMRIRTSWLSREAALAVLFFALSALWAWQRYQYGDGESALLPLAVLFCALAAVYCTAMIYQSLKPIAAWHHPLTSACYLALALHSGAALFAAVSQSPKAAALVLPFAAAAAFGKGLHYRRIGKVRDVRIGRAAGFSRAKAKLLETGHTGQTFLTREFMFSAPAAMLAKMRAASMLLCFIPPVIGAVLLLFWQTALWMIIALPFMFAGLLMERWLFFAEARHSIRAYHGDGKP